MREGQHNKDGITLDEMVNIAHEERAKQLKLAQQFRFDINKHVEDEKYCLHVMSQGTKWEIAGLGAIGVIAGPPKSRKTAITSAITAAGLGNVPVLGFQLDINKGRILSFDTEQREGSFAKVNRNIHRWAKVPVGVNPDNYESYHLRSLFPEQRLAMISALVTEEPKPSLLIIDVISDLMYDFNDLVSSQKIVEEIMKLAGNNTLTILTIHLGKGGLVLGHLGSALARKVDFLIEVKLSEDDYHESIVTCKLTRDVSMFPEFRIKQERTPPRIYRPDLELQGYFGGMSANQNEIIENPFAPTPLPAPIDNNPFAPDPMPFKTNNKVEDIIIPISKHNLAIKKTPEIDNIPF